MECLLQMMKVHCNKQKKIKQIKVMGDESSNALKFLKTHSQRLLTKEFLGTYSPKFLKMVENN